MTATERIREILRTRYPCQDLPGGAITDIAAEVGVTRQLVSKLARDMGLVGRLRLTGTTYQCQHCGEPFYLQPAQRKRLYCSIACQVADHALNLTCDQCGKEYVLSGRKAITFLSNRRRNPSITRNYCSKACTNESWKGVKFSKGGNR